MDKRKLTLADCFKYPNADVMTSQNYLITVQKILVEYYNQGLGVSDYKLKLRSIHSLTEEEKKYMENYFPTVAEIINY